jgi:tRNA isopentenyl-2-thiomethyl-A-37 hydroxylase MiaE
MYYYEDYWNLMKKYDDKGVDRRVSTFMNREE